MQMTHLDHDSMTHYYAQGQALTRLDELFCSIPSWWLTRMQSNVRIQGDPIILARSGLSDHVAVRWTSSDGYVSDQATKISRAQTKHPLYARALATRVNNLGADWLGSLPYDQQLRIWVRLFREASQVVRDHESMNGSKVGRAVIFRRMVRALWTNEVGDALALQAKHRLARVHLLVEGPKVLMAKPHEFAVEHDKALTDLTSAELRASKAIIANPATKEGTRRMERRRQDGLERKLKLWAPRGKTKRLHALVDSRSLDIVTDPPRILEGLAEYWGDVFRARDGDPGAASELIDRFPMNEPMGDPSPPVVRDIARVLQVTGDSTPGPDGIPYSAWRAAQPMVLPFLREGLDRLQTRRPMSDDFNINLGFFLPRGDKAEDTVGVNARPTLVARSRRRTPLTRSSLGR